MTVEETKVSYNYNKNSLFSEFVRRLASKE
jgi:hypothetical protein